jgi:hypothetical protein
MSRARRCPVWRSRPRHAIRLVAVLASFCGVGCTHVLYEGPRRPASKVALLRTVKISIEGVDSRSVSGTVFELLPGNHWFDYELDEAVRAGTTYLPWVPQSACIKLQAGHSYTLKADVDGKEWGLVLMDDTLGLEDESYCSWEAKGD